MSDIANTQITGGTIAYEDGKKAAEEYAPPKKAKVELSFACAEGTSMAVAQTTIDHVAWLAENKVREMLGLPTIAGPAGKPTMMTTTAPVDVGPTLGETPKKTRAKKETPPPAEPAFDPAAIEEPAADPAAVADPAAIEDVISLPDQTAKDPAAMDMSEFDVAGTVEITDGDLNAAVAKRNGELGDPPLIRGLIAEFNPTPGQPFQLRQIGQERRQEFLDKLAKLSK